jgi:hypothetical protein
MASAARLHTRTLAWVRDSTWSSLFGYAYFLIFAGLLLRLAAPASLRSQLRPLLLAAPVLPFVAKELAHLPDFVERFRAAIAHRSGWARFACAFFPPELIGLLRLERALRGGFAGWVRRRPSFARPAGQAFGFLDRGSYSTAVAIVLVSSLIELPVAALVIPLFLHDPMSRTVIHLTLGGLCLSTLAWTLGDRWMVRGSWHVLTEACLDLQVGARLRCAVPLSAIESCAVTDAPRAQWCASHQLRLRETLLVTPLDRPNVVLRLKPGNRVRATSCGMEVDCAAAIFLYVDRPAALISALESSLKRSWAQR